MAGVGGGRVEKPGADHRDAAAFGMLGLKLVDRHRIVGRRRQARISVDGRKPRLRHPPAEISDGVIGELPRRRQEMNAGQCRQERLVGRNERGKRARRNRRSLSTQRCEPTQYVLKRRTRQEIFCFSECSRSTPASFSSKSNRSSLQAGGVSKRWRRVGGRPDTCASRLEARVWKIAVAPRSKPMALRARYINQRCVRASPIIASASWRRA